MALLHVIVTSWAHRKKTGIRPKHCHVSFIIKLSVNQISFFYPKIRSDCAQRCGQSVSFNSWCYSCWPFGRCEDKYTCTYIYIDIPPYSILHNAVPSAAVTCITVSRHSHTIWPADPATPVDWLSLGPMIIDQNLARQAQGHKWTTTFCPCIIN